MFLMRITSVFEPCGEECGTKYDESTACPKCGAGGIQKSTLTLDFRRLPKRADIAATIANERVVSQRLAQLMVDAGVSGFELRPVRHKARYDDDPADLAATSAGRALLEEAHRLGYALTSWQFWVWLNRPEQSNRVDNAQRENTSKLERSDAAQRGIWPVWYQLVITSLPLPCVPPTCFGINPFDKDTEGKYRCPLGHVSGLNILSEVSVAGAAWQGSDLSLTSEFVGARGGVLRPAPLILVSPKVRALLLDNRIKGAEFEVAHLV
jgi:hypothetical protein